MDSEACMARTNGRAALGRGCALPDMTSTMPETAHTLRACASEFLFCTPKLASYMTCVWLASSWSVVVTVDGQDRNTAHATFTVLLSFLGAEMFALHRCTLFSTADWPISCYHWNCYSRAVSELACERIGLCTIGAQSLNILLLRAHSILLHSTLFILGFQARTNPSLPFARPGLCLLTSIV